MRMQVRVNKEKEGNWNDNLIAVMADKYEELCNRGALPNSSQRPY